MRLFRAVFPCVGLLALLGLSLPAAAGERPADVSGVVKIRLIGPDGNALAHAAADITQPREFPVPDKVPHLAVQSDAGGIVEFPWPVGNPRFDVDVKGVAYGSTGVVTVLAGQTAVAPMPPMVPYATISGAVANGKGARITISESDNLNDIDLPADRDGRFSAQVRAGAWWVSAMRPGDANRQDAGQVVVWPGDVVRDLQFSPEEIPPPRPQPAPATHPVPQADADVWASGTVRDPAGHPIAGAYLSAIIDAPMGGLREGEPETVIATTDANGHYKIRSESDDPGWLKASISGKPPETRRIGFMGPRQPGPQTDFVLADKGGALDVHVILDGQPAAGVIVKMARETIDLGEEFGGPQHLRELPKLVSNEDIVAVTGPNGIAHFTALPPGRYRVVSAASSHVADSLWEAPAWALDRSLDPHMPYAIAEGVVVATGRTSTQRMNLYPQPSEMVFHAIDHQGKPIVGDVAMNFGPVDAQVFGGGNAHFDASGDDTEKFGGPGMAHVEFRYRQAPDGTRPMSEPCYSAAVDIANSPRLTGVSPVHTAAMWLGLGSVSVELRDETGKPARGYVEICNGGIIMIGSTDAQGRITFERLPSWNYELKGRIIGGKSATFESGDSSPVPPDADLIGKFFIPPRSFGISHNQDLHLVLQAQPACYLRGVLHVPPRQAGIYYDVYFDRSDYDLMLDLDQSTGRFIVGPMAAGKLGVLAKPRDNDSWNVAQQPSRQTVSLEPGKVATADLAPPPPTTESALLLGRVVNADGTPAYGATVQYFLPQDWRPYLGAVADATGAFRTHAAESFIGNADPPPPGGPPTPVIVAMLPGSAGATILDAAGHFDKPFTINLLTPITVPGTVTLGGKNLAGEPGQFRILAAYQGKGNLNRTLSLWVTPPADGSFELAGLTPGTYQIQASLDNIWLSDTVTLTVSADKQQLPPIHLDIPAPGGPAVVHVVSAKGKPLCGVRVIVDRPAGPLTDLDWPAAFTTDGAGDAWIPALEAGKHTARLKDGLANVGFTVAPLPATALVEVKLQAR